MGFSNTQKIYELANYLNTQAEFISFDAKEAYFYNLVADELAALPFITYNPRINIDSGKKVVTLKLTNIRGEKYSYDKSSLKITAEIIYNKQAVVEYVEFTKKGDSYEGEIDTSKLKNPDFYNVRFTVTTTVNNKSFIFNANNYLVGTTKVSVSHVRFDITKTKISSNTLP